MGDEAVSLLEVNPIGFGSRVAFCISAPATKDVTRSSPLGLPPLRLGCHRFCNREIGSERFLAAGSGGARENLCYNYASLRRGVVAAVVLISPVSEVQFLPPPPLQREAKVRE